MLVDAPQRLEVEVSFFEDRGKLYVQRTQGKGLASVARSSDHGPVYTRLRDHGSNRTRSVRGDHESRRGFG